MIYESPISDSNESSQLVTMRAAGTSLSVSLQWDDTWNEEADNLNKLLYQRAASIPLMASDGTIIRDYDYLLYFETVPSTVSDVEAFIETADALPQKIKDLPTYQQVSALLEEKSFWVEVNDLAQLYAEQLGWQVTVQKGDETVVSTMRPGGWSYFDDNSAYRFVTSLDKANIGKDDLQYVTMEYDDGLA